MQTAEYALMELVIIVNEMKELRTVLKSKEIVSSEVSIETQIIWKEIVRLNELLFKV